MPDEVPSAERHWQLEFLAHDGEAGQRAVHWRVVGTDDERPSETTYLCEADARLGAEAIITRHAYELRRVWECPACGYHGRVVQAIQALVTARLGGFGRGGH